MENTEEFKLAKDGKMFAIGHKDDMDYVGVKENGKLVVYFGPAVDDAQSPEEHHKKIVELNNKGDL